MKGFLSSSPTCLLDWPQRNQRADSFSAQDVKYVQRFAVTEAPEVATEQCDPGDSTALTEQFCFFSFSKKIPQHCATERHCRGYRVT